MLDHSLHIALPPDLACAAIEASWAEPHPVARLGFIPETIVMVYAPRDTEELAVVERLLQVSYWFAGGKTYS